MTAHFQRELDRLKNKLLHLCAMVEESLRKSVRSLHSRDTELARAVIDADVDIDQVEVDVEEDCLKILALHQPVAIDLRYIVTAMKINNDLERVGDLAVNIAERATALAEAGGFEVPADFSEMAQVTQEMIKNSIDALIDMDADLARQVCAADDTVDQHNRQMFERVEAEGRAHPEWLPVLLDLLSASRHLERIADHATNIAEDVIYMAEGRIARHRADTKPDRPEQF